MLGFINFFIAQWFFVRLCVVEVEGRVMKYGLIYPIVPLTGWWSEFIPKWYFTSLFKKGS